MAAHSEFSGMDLYEDYKSPFDFNAGVNRNYLYLSPSINLSPPGSPTLAKSGNLLLFLFKNLYMESLVINIWKKRTFQIKNL